VAKPKPDVDPARGKRKTEPTTVCIVSARRFKLKEVLRQTVRFPLEKKDVAVRKGDIMP